MKRKEARRIATQTLYQIEMTDFEPDQALQNVLEDRAPDSFLSQIVHGTVRHQEAVDQKIRNALANWRLERLSRVDRAILRLAVYEMLFTQDAAPAVIINEAVELGKYFGSEENGKFINGVLSEVHRQLSESER